MIFDVVSFNEETQKWEWALVRTKKALESGEADSRECALAALQDARYERGF